MGRPAICLLFQVNSAGGERINSKRVRIPTLRYFIKEFPKSHVTLMYNHNRLLDLRLEDKNWKMTYWIPILWLQIPQLSPGSWLMMIFDIIGFYRDMWVMWVPLTPSFDNYTFRSDSKGLTESEWLHDNEWIDPFSAGNIPDIWENSIIVTIWMIYQVFILIFVSVLSFICPRQGRRNGNVSFWWTPTGPFQFVFRC